MRQEVSRAVESVDVPRAEVGACYAFGWGQMKKYVLEVFLVTVVALVISLPGYALMDADEEMGHGNDVLGVIGLIYLILVTRPFKYGAFFVFLRSVKNHQVKVKDMFDALQNYLNVVLANLFVLVIVAVGVVLFIVPGIVLACRLSFTPFLVVERKMEAVEAVKESWRLTGGHAWTIFLIGLLAIPISVLGLAILGVGVIGAMMWVGMTHAALYHAISSSKEAWPQEVEPGAGAEQV